MSCDTTGSRPPPRARSAKGARKRGFGIRLCLGIAFAAALGAAGCLIPGQRSTEVEAETTGAILERCAEAVERMHFDLKAVDRSHQIVVAEGKVEGGLSFHEVHLSIKVIHLEGRRFRVEAIATADGRGIRAGVEKKARKLFFRELEETTGGFLD